MMFATVCTEFYVVYLEKLIKSIIQNNPDFNISFAVFIDGTVTNEHIEKLNSIYMGFIFYDVDTEKYSLFGKNNAKFYSIEAFNLDADKVIFIDADMICLNSINDLLYTGCDFGAVIENRRQCDFNAGLMVIGKKYLNKELYSLLLTCDHTKIERFGNDQKIFNMFFDNKFTRLENKFNVLISEIDFVDYNDIVFLHYIFKPDLEKGQVRMEYKYIDLWNKI